MKTINHKPSTGVRTS